ncbi:MAG: PepSY domain-containing protein [Acidobacteria bacterium]|nr:PepSY domain-containing protein [Acidobacteriota bacterium]
MPALTGLYIWIPRMWSWTAVRAVALFRTGLPSKARDFNWHNVIGVWSAAVLVVLTFTGMCISFPKTYDVIYAVTGIERPPLAAAPSPPGASVVVSLEELDKAWGRAEAQMPSWRSIAMRLPQRAGQPLTFTFNDREQINPMARSTLTVDRATADVVRWEPYKGLTTGQRLRTWMRFGHTGELWGLPGQIVAGLASAGGCVLVYTGVSLACRRFLLWRARRRRRLIRTDVRERSAA